MLSGGPECVLVKWQHNSHTYETLPRLGAPIVAVSCSPDGTAYATCHSDNCEWFSVTKLIVRLSVMLRQ